MPPPPFIATTEQDLNNDIGSLNAHVVGSFTIHFAHAIPETTALAAIHLPSGVTLTIDGGSHSLIGDASQRGLFISSGTVAIDNLTISGAHAVGGAGTGGGGGGAGLGGGLFIGSG